MEEKAGRYFEEAIILTEKPHSYPKDSSVVLNMAGAPTPTNILMWICQVLCRYRIGQK